MSAIVLALAVAYEEQFGEEIPDMFVMGEDNIVNLKEFLELALERGSPLRPSDFGLEREPPEARPMSNGARVW